MMRKFPFKLFVSAVVFILLTLVVYSQYDRAFDQGLLNEFKNSGDFNYSVDPIRYPGFLDVLLALLGQIINILMYPFSKASPGWLTLIGYMVVIAILVYAIVKALNLDVGTLFFIGSGKSSGLQISEEEMSKTNLENLMRQALDNGDYRLAIRYMYLIALHHLAGKDMVHLKPGKTSSDYLHEISNETIYHDFGRLNYFFEYGWYGEFPIDQKIYDKANGAFQHFLQQLK